jgi:hypothetical protein
MPRLIPRLAAVAAPLFLASVLLGAGPAAAGDPWGSVDCTKEPTNPQCVITVGTTDAPGSKGSNGTSACKDVLGRVVPCFVEGAGWYGGDGCYYQLAMGTDLAGANALGGVPNPPGAWYVGVCGYPPVPGFTRFRVFGTPPGPQLLADEAVRALRLPSPVIRVNPALPAPQIVFLPTWVWLGADSWGLRSASASVPGMSVTATATPVTLVLSTGDGGSMTCSGPGTPWTSGTDPAKVSPTCGHTYTTLPAGGTYTLRATVTWEISWAGGGATGTVPALTTTAAVDLRVKEAGALNSNGVG